MSASLDWIATRRRTWEAPEPEPGVSSSRSMAGLLSLPPSIAPDLVSACIAWFRSYRAGVVSSRFGESPGNPKFFGDIGFVADLPYLVFQEPSASIAYESGGGYIQDGVLLASIFAAPKTYARQLGYAVRNALADAPLVFAEGDLMVLRPRQPFFGAAGDIAPGGVTSQNEYIIAFEYKFQNVLSGNPLG